ncbi:MAG TPA: site-2 protease family protein [Candidatus Dormibacteraeota bacterium]|nr:site-2 protease family protein [Candidatus Dormibacteraeota bacterium]
MLNNLSGGDLAVVLLSIIIALSIHEAMHAYVAHWLGDTTAQDMGRLTLNPLKHIDAVTTVLLPMVLILSGLPPFFIAKPVPFNPDRVKYDEFGTALVGVAGPLTNLVLACLAAGVFRLWGAGLSSFFYNSLVIFTEVNIGFFIFNMIPFPPLDGSRLLYAFAPEPLQEIMRQIESFGFVGIILFMLIIFQFIAGPIGNVENSILNFLLG